VGRGGEKMVRGGRMSLEWKWWIWISFKILLSGGSMKDVVDLNRYKWMNGWTWDIILNYE
jgi:hypothetical protein